MATNEEFDDDIPIPEFTAEEKEFNKMIERGADVPGWQLLDVGQCCYSDMQLIKVNDIPFNGLHQLQWKDRLFEILQEDDEWSYVHRIK